VFSNLQSIKVSTFNKQRMLLKIERDLALLKSDIKRIEEGIELSVLAELDEKGKPLHSNAQKREIAASQMLQSSPAYLELVKQRDMIIESQHILRFEHDSLRADFDSWRIASRFLNA